LPDRRHPLSIPRRALRRLLVLACAIGVLLVPAAAWADAPMCDENAQTVDAPLPIYPSKGGEISAVPSCERDAMRLDAAPQQRPDRPLLDAQATDRGLALGANVPACAKSARLALSTRAIGQARAGAAADVFRPPRA
jgi:hypothetical protein